MSWFTADAPGFLRDLADNNDRDWFHANKKRYEVALKKPFEAFAAEMIRRMLEIDPAVSTTTPAKAIFRINRDTRFSKDKRPYKEHAAMVIAPGERHAPGVTGLYFQFGKDTLSIASGCYFLEPEQLARVRRHLAGAGAEFRDLLGDPGFVRYFGEMHGEKNKVLPPEFKEAAAREPLLFNKQFFYWKEHPVAELLRDDLPDFVMDHMRACQPMNVFLTRPLRS